MLEKINEETKMAAETFDTGKLAELVRLALAEEVSLALLKRQGSRNLTCPRL